MPEKLEGLIADFVSHALRSAERSMALLACAIAGWVAMVRAAVCLTLVFALALLLLPSLAFAQSPGANPDDVLGLIQQILAAAQAKNWLLAIPLVVLALIAAFRLWVVPRVQALAWFTTDRGGAALGLLGAFVQAVLGAVLLPGPHGIGQVVVGAISLLLANQLLFGYLKKILGPDGNARAQEVAVAAGQAGALAASSSEAAAALINGAVKR